MGSRRPTRIRKAALVSFEKVMRNGRSYDVASWLANDVVIWYVSAVDVPLVGHCVLMLDLVKVFG